MVSAWFTRLSPGMTLRASARPGCVGAPGWARVSARWRHTFRPTHLLFVSLLPIYNQCSLKDENACWSTRLMCSAEVRACFSCSMRGSISCQAEWEAEFDRYKAFPEWQQRRSMTLDEFKHIFFWEVCM